MNEKQYYKKIQDSLKSMTKERWLEIVLMAGIYNKKGELTYLYGGKAKPDSLYYEEQGEFMS